MEEKIINLYIEIEKLFDEQDREFERGGENFNYGASTAYYRCLQEIKKHFDFVEFPEGEQWT